MIGTSLGYHVRQLDFVKRYPRARRFLRNVSVAAASALLPKGVRKDIGGAGNFIMHPEFSFCDYRAWGAGKNNGFETLLQRTRGKRVVFDVGAHIGLTSLPMSRVVASGGICDAFEPSEANLRYLRWHVAANASERIRVHPVLVGDRSSDEVPFFEASCETGMNAMVRNDMRSGIDYAETTRKMISLDAFCAEHQRFPELIKIDVEGAEVDVLNGAYQTLLVHRPELVLSVHPPFLHRYGQDVSTLRALLEGLGYVNPVSGSLPDLFDMSEHHLVHRSYLI
jgi:FkbM family methyltransferase